jgi:hypothetical protein
VRTSQQFRSPFVLRVCLRSHVPSPPDPSWNAQVSKAYDQEFDNPNPSQHIFRTSDACYHISLWPSHKVRTICFSHSASFLFEIDSSIRVFLMLSLCFCKSVLQSHSIRQTRYFRMQCPEYTGNLPLLKGLLHNAQRSTCSSDISILNKS